MFLHYTWIVMALLLADIALSIFLIAKFKKLEKFQTSEAHTNLELINQSLNRLSEIAEKFENRPGSGGIPRYSLSEEPGEPSNQNKEQRVLSMIRQGENPRVISSKLGISRSEIDLLMASEKLGNDRRNAKVDISN